MIRTVNEDEVNMLVKVLDGMVKAGHKEHRHGEIFDLPAEDAAPLIERGVLAKVTRAYRMTVRTDLVAPQDFSLVSPKMTSASTSKKEGNK
jgi:hypothetical protein